MKKLLQILILIVSIGSFSTAKAQWCVPNTVIPYNADMPGITHIVFNTIDRVSLDLENFPNNSYVNTGLSTLVFKGETYDIDITYTIDGNICPDMNLRVWIDFNQDGQLDDIGETVISEDNLLPGTFNGTFTIPASATAGITRMRVTAKMSSLGGHSLPTPCDDPADILGYHGEIEDYDIEILETTGINSPVQTNDFNVSYDVDGSISCSFTVKDHKETSIKLLNVQGEKVKEIISSQKLIPGKHSYDVITDELSQGIYFLTLNVDGYSHVKRTIIN